MTIDQLKIQNLILLDCISGSKAYGLDLPTSDTDKRGVFYPSKKQFFGLEFPGQVSNETNDESYSEIGRFTDLLTKANPTMIELLHTPKAFVLHKHPFFDKIAPEWYLSKLCKNTFASYAASQIKKARGLKKKIHNPMDKERKNVPDFCYVVDKQGSVSLTTFLEAHGVQQEQCGLVKIPHMHEVYGLYFDKNGDQGYKGIFSGPDANEVSHSSVSKGIMPDGIMTFNKSGYSTYCKEYREYWNWVDKRNDERYQNTLNHAKNYDAKNLMHTFRLLHVALEIAEEGKVNVHRKDREFLLKIRRGEFKYETLIEMAEEHLLKIETAYDRSGLPEQPNQQALENWLVEFRYELY